MQLDIVLKESIEMIKKNPLIIIPPFLANVIIYILSIAVIGSLIVAVVGGAEVFSALFILVFVVFSIVLHSLSTAITITMIKETLNKGFCTLLEGVRLTLSRLSAILLAALAVGVMSTVGLMLYILPALVVMFFTMFTFVILILKDTGATLAITESARTVWTNLYESVLLFMLISLTGLLVWYVGDTMRVVPLVGHIFNALLTGSFWSFSSVVLVKGYLELQK